MKRILFVVFCILIILLSCVGIANVSADGRKPPTPLPEQSHGCDKSNGNPHCQGQVDPPAPQPKPTNDQPRPTSEPRQPKSHDDPVIVASPTATATRTAMPTMTATAVPTLIAYPLMATGCPPTVAETSTIWPYVIALAGIILLCTLPLWGLRHKQK